MLQILDRARRFNRGSMALGASPFASLTGSLEWCARCGQYVDHETKAAHRDTTYVYKRWCLRCGGVLASGVYDNVPLLGGPLPAAAVEWTTEPGKDRR